MKIPNFVFKEQRFTLEQLKKLSIFTDQVIYNVKYDLPTPYFKNVNGIIKKNEFCGLANFNALCFLNSVIQILFSSKNFIKEMKFKQKKSVFFEILNDLFREMKKQQVINQIKHLLDLNSNYKLKFDIFKKTGRVSDVIQSFSQICQQEECHIFDMIANSNLFFKYPIIKQFKRFGMSKKSKIANRLIKDLEVNKILIFSGCLEEKIRTAPIGKNSEFI